ncbi:MAG: pseudouridine synthase [Beijerinckiaceae bacterium]|jgi:16S rRNA pseudouridine516 synthase
MSKAAAPVRLDKLLANLGYGSRREVQALVRASRVVLDGAPVTAADERIALSPQLPQRLSIGGVPCDPPPGLVLMMHKPLGMTCSHKETGPLVYDLLPPRWRLRDPPVSSIGRLDKETSGLLLLTDDGDLLHKIISPKARIAKRYRATLARPLRGDEAALFASGTLMLEGETKPLEPAKIEILSPRSAALTITEGRYHQARRMFAAAGNHVLSLHRDRIGGLTLDPALDAGATRLLDPDEVRLIFNDQS